jgi:ABC-type sugar transport system substrate-binding protein
MRVWALILGVFVLGAAGCGRTEEGKAPSARRVVGMALLTQTHDFYKDLEQAAREEAKSRNLELSIVACEMDPAKQAAQLEDFVTQGVVAIVVAPCDSDAIGPHLDAIERARIPVFTADIAARRGKVVAHVASDNEKGGQLAAATLAQLLGGRGDVLIIDHPTVASVQDRVKGFQEELKKHPEMKIVGRPTADGQRARAMAAMEDMLQAHPALKGVFGINDDSALGATAVLDAAGRKDIAVVGFDATPQALAAIKAGGPLKADIAQDPKTIGRTVIELVDRHLKGEQVPPLVAVPVTVVDAATLAAAK